MENSLKNFFDNFFNKEVDSENINSDINIGIFICDIIFNKKVSVIEYNINGIMNNFVNINDIYKIIKNESDFDYLNSGSYYMSKSKFFEKKENRGILFNKCYCEISNIVYVVKKVMLRKEKSVDFVGGNIINDIDKKLKELGF